MSNNKKRVEAIVENNNNKAYRNSETNTDIPGIIVRYAELSGEERLQNSRHFCQIHSKQVWSLQRQLHADGISAQHCQRRRSKELENQ